MTPEQLAEDVTDAWELRYRRTCEHVYLLPDDVTDDLNSRIAAAIAGAEQAVRADERESILARVYAADEKAALAVASLCDLEMDRSGGLLGRIRDRAAAIRTWKTKSPE